MINSEIVTQDKYVNVPGGEIFTRRWTPSSISKNTPLVLLHDSLGCAELWRDFPETLAHLLNRQVIAYDRLGFGKSSARQELPSVNFIREETEVFFPVIGSALDITDYALFGHSVGGGMALTIASMSSSSCRAVTSVSAQAFVEERTLAGIRTAKEHYNNPEQLSRLAKWHGGKAEWVLKAWTDVWLSPGFAGWSLADTLPQIKCPVLAIHGDRDEYGSIAFPKMISDLAGGTSEMVILEDCGHVPHREQPEKVLNNLAAFFARFDV